MTTTVEEHDRPILFTGWSIRRIFDGPKTETRRRTGLEDINEDPDRYTHDTDHGFWSEDEYYRVLSGRDGVGAKSVKSPYGGPHDPLWVREAFRFPAVNDEISPIEYVGAGCNVWRYEADDAIYDPGDWTERNEYGWGRLRPSIHMPKKICRLRLRLKSACLQRLQDVSIEAALREGVDKHPAQLGRSPSTAGRMRVGQVVP